MKLIYCPQCGDIVKLQKAPRECWCGLSYGHYLDDGLNAVIGGLAIPLGISNSSFVDALHNIPVDGLGERFEAFVIPKVCPTIKKQKREIIMQNCHFCKSN